MDNPTIDTTVALLQQTSVIQTATLTRIEGKLDKIEERLQGYATLEEVERKYVTKESHNNLSDKVASAYRVVWTVGSAVILLAIQAIWELLKGGK